MKCKHCQAELDIQSVLNKAEFSWPLRQMVWSICSGCSEGNHVRFENGIAQVISLQGYPGYEYDVISSANEPTIEVRVDPNCLQVWFHGRHNEVKARA